MPQYKCMICDTTPDQLSHHKSHLKTSKHKDKKELLKLQLEKLTPEELNETYKTTNIEDIVKDNETLIMDEPIECDITNKESLKDKIHQIHNYLRNHGAGYGMNALKIFNLFYGLKKIEECGLFDMVGLDTCCKFSYLLEFSKKTSDEKLNNLVIGPVLDSINEKIKELLFYELPKNLKGSVFAYLLKEINMISKIEQTTNVLLSGKVYEYFIGRDESAISELGAYFTDRHITKFCYKKGNPQRNEDGTIPTMIDMFGGSGGFTTEYISFMNERYPGMINWMNEINKIYHYDMNEDVIKSAGLELFCLSGVLPNMQNLKIKNSFTDDFGGRKFQYIFTNPPYGGDKQKKTSAQEKRQKIKDYIKDELKTTSDPEIKEKRTKQLKVIEAQEKVDKKELDKLNVNVDSCKGRIQKFAVKHKLKGNDKESCSLMLLMDMVEEGGRVVGVLKEGVFFNKTYKDLRKCLIEHYNVKEVISVDSSQFENTSTKTSILIFDNTPEKTSEVLFSDLIVEKYTEDRYEEVDGQICLVENKGDIKEVYDKVISVASREELLANPIYSLNGKDYNKKTIVCGEGYELVKLGDICEFKPKSKRNASFGQSMGKYNFYSSSDKVKKCDVADYNEECLIIGTGGSCNIKLDKYFSCSMDNLLVKSKYNLYIYYLFISKMELLQEGFNGTTIKHLSKDYLKNIQIPIPKTPEKIQEWVTKISVPYNEKHEKEKRVKELETFVQERIKYIGDNEHCDEVELGCLCEINPETMKKNQYTKINYIDIGSVKEGKINNIELMTDNYPSRAKRIIKKYDILYSTVRPNLKGYTLISENIENGIATTGFAVIRTKKINAMYIYSLLTDEKITDYLIKNSSGSSYPAVNSNIFKLIKIKLPKNKQFIEELEPTFQEIETLQNEVKYADKLYKQYIQELGNEAIKLN